MAWARDQDMQVAYCADPRHTSYVGRAIHARVIHSEDPEDTNTGRVRETRQSEYGHSTYAAPSTAILLISAATHSPAYTTARTSVLPLNYHHVRNRQHHTFDLP